MRVVFDANILISALLSARGAPAHALAAWGEGRFELTVSSAILDELGRVLRYPRLRERYALNEETIERFLRLLARQAILVEPRERLAAVTADESDNRYLECAVAGGAVILVSGDHHLLDLVEYQGVRILSCADFLAWLELGVAQDLEN